MRGELEISIRFRLILNLEVVNVGLLFGVVLVNIVQRREAVQRLQYCLDLVGLLFQMLLLVLLLSQDLLKQCLGAVQDLQLVVFELLYYGHFCLFLLFGYFFLTTHLL